MYIYIVPWSYLHQLSYLGGPTLYDHCYKIQLYIK